MLERRVSNGARATIRTAGGQLNISICLVIVTFSLVLPATLAGAEDDEFSITVDITVLPDDYVQWELVVTKGQTVRIELSAEEGPLDFYFMEPADYSDFLTAWENPPSEDFGYVTGLSVRDSQTINKSSVIDISGVYYFVVVNEGASNVRVVGTISTLYSEDDLLLAILLVLLIVGVVVIAFLVYAYASKRDQAVRPPPSSRVGEGRYSVPPPAISFQPKMDKGNKIGSICSVCRKPIPENALECPHCGARQHGT